MAYEKQTWIDGDASTPLSADRLNHIEEGLAAASELQAHLTPVELTWLDGVMDDLDPVLEVGGLAYVTQHAGRVDITISGSYPEELISALHVLNLPHFPKDADSDNWGENPFDVQLFQGVKFLTKLWPGLVYLERSYGDLSIRAYLDTALAVVREVGADRMALSVSYYTDELPPHGSTP